MSFEKLAGLSAAGTQYDSLKTMVRWRAVRLEWSQPTDPLPVQRVIDFLPALTACNDLSTLTELECANKTIFQVSGKW